MTQRIIARGLAGLAGLGLGGAALAGATGTNAVRDTFSDTWVAADALGRLLPDYATAGPPRPDRQVGIFYFLWLGAHVNGGPYDITRILAQHPDAMEHPTSPPWGPLYAPHHWGESLFGYYNTDDPWVLRKHAQMLSDAGVDVVIFDVTNQHTYRKNYQALLRVFAQVRADGGRTPQVAFLCPFWAPAKVVAELYRDLYQPGLHPELWYRWEGRPLILADSQRIGARESFGQHRQPMPLLPGHTLGQTLHVSRPLRAAGGSFPTWRGANAALTLTLRRGDASGPVVARRRFTRIRDNDWLLLSLDPPAPPGSYHLEASRPSGRVGWWSEAQDAYPHGQATADGRPVAGDRNLRLAYADAATTELLRFFTFRKPQPDYFRGPTGPNMWSWLEVYPQHVFTNAAGAREQMSVGVAQNAVHGRLGAMSEPGARGRGFHDGHVDLSPGAVRRGRNFAEQFERALRVDPRFIFITGWNEWIAGRYAEFNGVRRPVMFVDEFDQAHSRDIEPLKGGHGDDYYYQMIAFIRRYKGVRPPLQAGPPRAIRLDGDFAQWRTVRPEYRDDQGDVAHRDFPGYNHCARYRDASGRNDLAAAQVAYDCDQLYFHVRARDPLTSPEGDRWMLLLLDTDQDPRTGWLGAEFVANRRRTAAGQPLLERCLPGGGWETVGPLAARWDGAELHLAIAREALGLPGGTGAPLALHFKWADNAPRGADPLSFFTDGDTAPNGRAWYRFSAPGVGAPAP